MDKKFNLNKYSRFGGQVLSDLLYFAENNKNTTFAAQGQVSYDQLLLNPPRTGR
jgi:hypothetical protein